MECHREVHSATNKDAPETPRQRRERAGKEGQVLVGRFDDRKKDA